MLARIPLEVTAYHEAGHAVMACLQGERFQYATIEPVDDALGAVAYTSSYAERYEHAEMSEDEESDLDTVARQLVLCAVAGITAEEIRFGHYYEEGATDDYGKIVDVLIRHCGEQAAIEDYFAATRTQAHDLLRLPVNWAKVERVAGLLLEKKTVYEGEIQRVF